MTDDTTETTDASLATGGHDRFERNHYFHGKLMTARDMAAEQAYHAGSRRAHARSVAGSGVAWGLDAAVRDDGEGTLEVSVERGYAIDERGRPVVVPQRRETSVDRADLDGATTVTVSLAYDACLKESVPVSGGESACEDECAYNRVLEVYDIEVEPGHPDGPQQPVPEVSFPDRDDLGTVADREQPDAGDPGLATIASSYRASASHTSADPESTSVFVGAFTEGPAPEWDRVPGLPTSYVYTNDMLYAATARHAADFENPHQVTLQSSASASGDGASVSILDDESDAPAVTVASDDGSVDVGHQAAQTIDFSIEDRLAELVSETVSPMIDARASQIVENRVEPLERYAAEMALKHKGLVFERVASQFEAPTATRVSRLARAAVDDRLERVTDAEAADNRRLRIVVEGDPSLTIYSDDVYPDMLEDFLEDERAVASEVEGQVTAASYERLREALDRFESVLGRDEPTTLQLAAAQDDICDAAEWLDPVEEEPPADAPETTTVPDLEGRLEPDAVNQLEGTSLTSSVAYEPVRTASQLASWDYGVVMAQSPTAGSQVPVETTVQLSVLVSREVTVLTNLGDARAEELASQGIRWVHELAEADVASVASNTSFSVQQVETWQSQAREYLKALEVSLMQQVDLQDALNVSTSFEGTSLTELRDLSDQELQSMVTESTNQATIDPEDAQTFLESSQTLQFDPQQFDYDFDLGDTTLTDVTTTTDTDFTTSF